MRLRRASREPAAQEAPASAPTAWDGLPMVEAPAVVIRAARAADLAADRPAA